MRTVSMFSAALVLAACSSSDGPAPPSAAVDPQLAAEGKCLNDEAMNAVKLPKYEGWGAYAMFLPRNVERFCEYWGRGY